MWSIDALDNWVGVLCRETGGAADLVAVLGVAGRLVGDDRWVHADPPPPGLAWLRLWLLHGTVHELAAGLATGPTGPAAGPSGGLTRDALDARYGPGRWTPAMPPHVPHDVVGYRVAPPGAPYACRVEVAFEPRPLAPPGAVAFAPLPPTPPGAAVGFGPRPPGPAGAAVELRVRRERVGGPPGVTAATLAGWVEQVCRAAPGTAAAVLAGLGLAGSVTPAGSYLRVTPTPPGTTDVQLLLDDAGLATLEVHLLDSALTRADLDALLGPGSVPPRLHPFSDHTLSYRADRPGAPFGCTVSASFAEQPGPATAAHRVALRRRPPG